MEFRVLPRSLRPACSDLEPSCFGLTFCEAKRCAVDLRRGLTGPLTFCPVTGVASAAQYPVRLHRRGAA